MTDQSVSTAQAGKRAAILEAARRLLVRRGHAELVLDDVAREAGVAKGTLYLYFRSKDELLEAAFQDLAVRLGEDLDTLAGSPLRGRPLLVKAAGAILGHLDRNRDFISRLTSGPIPQGRVLQTFRANVGRAAAILERAGAGAGLPFAAFALFALCRGALLQKAMEGTKAPLARRAPEIADFLLRGAGGRA